MTPIKHFDIFVVQLLFMISLSGCMYKVSRTSSGDSIINPKYYKLPKTSPINSFHIIDTTAIYKLKYYIMDKTRFEPNKEDYDEFLKFYSDGTFLRISTDKPLAKKDFEKDINSTWRGRFALTGQSIELEEFCPNQAPSKFYDRWTLHGSFHSDTLILKRDKGNKLDFYIKQYN